MPDRKIKLLRVADTSDEIVTADLNYSYFFQEHMIRIGSLIHQKRLASGISREKLALKTGVNPEKIEAIEELGFNCAVWDLMMIIDELGICDSELANIKEV